MLHQVHPPVHLERAGFGLLWNELLPWHTFNISQRLKIRCQYCVGLLLPWVLKLGSEHYMLPFGGKELRWCCGIGVGAGLLVTWLTAVAMAP